MPRLVQHLFHFLRQAYVFDCKGSYVKPVFAELLRYVCSAHRGKLLQIRRHVKHGNLGLRYRIRHLRHKKTLQVVVYVRDGKGAVGAEKLLQKSLRVEHSHGIGAESPHSHHTEIRVAHGNGIFRAPFEIGELLCVDKVNVGFDHNVSSLIEQRSQPRQNGQIVGAQRILPRLKNIRDFSLVDKNCNLRLPDGELGAAHDFIFVGRHLKTVHHSIVAVVLPINHLPHLALEPTHKKTSFAARQNTVLLLLFYHKSPKNAILCEILL